MCVRVGDNEKWLSIKKAFYLWWSSSYSTPMASSRVVVVVVSGWLVRAIWSHLLCCCLCWTMLLLGRGCFSLVPLSLSPSIQHHSQCSHDINSHYDTSTVSIIVHTMLLLLLLLFARWFILRHNVVWHGALTILLRVTVTSVIESFYVFFPLHDCCLNDLMFEATQFNVQWSHNSQSSRVECVFISNILL